MPINVTKIKIIMGDKDINNKELAKRMNKKESQISKLFKRKNPRPSTVKQLADALGVEPLEIVKEE